VFELAHAGAGRAGCNVLRAVSLTVAGPGVLSVVGASGAGKSTLLAALAGAHDCSLAGHASLDGTAFPLAPDACTYIDAQQRLGGHEPLRQQLATRAGLPHDGVEQWLAAHGLAFDATLLDAPAEHAPVAVRRVLAVLALLERRARVYLVDEPTAGLEPPLARAVCERLRALAGRSLVVLATRDRTDCVALGGTVALLADGTLREHGQVEPFFAGPATPAGRAWVASGARCISPVHAPGGLWWLEPGRLVGLPRPGMLDDAQALFDYLARHGVTQVFCLESKLEYDASLPAAVGIGLHHFPVPDMLAPTAAQAAAMCRLAAIALDAGHAVAVHCRGGLGRTGTILSAFLVWLGADANEAVARVRSAQPYAVQSLAQYHFVHQFAEDLRAAR